MHDRYPLISVEELEPGIANSALRVVDCRFQLLQPTAGRESYLQGHIPGAVYADLDLDLAAPVGAGTGRHPLPDPAQFGQTLSRLGIGRDTQVVVYDECSGALAARAWWLLRWMGHERVRLLEGGIARWQALQLPVECGDMEVAPRHFEAAMHDARILQTAEIVEAGGDCRGLRLVDARDAARFRGEAEPIDMVAGHIPGAINLPFSATQNSDGTWKESDKLENMFSDALSNDLEGPWSVMCGSGVTACHLVMSGQLAGLREPRVYVGSWSEWITDPTRRVATGAA